MDSARESEHYQSSMMQELILLRAVNVIVGSDGCPAYVSAQMPGIKEKDEEATERFNELVMLKATGNTSSEENLEFQELYDAREEYLDQTPVADRIKELRRKRAFSTLIEAFDQYVIAEKVAY